MSWKSPDSLLRLYPRPWREHYGDEFLETAGDGPLHPQAVIDIVFGAVDAWLSGEVRRSVRVGDAPIGVGGTMLKSMLACETRRYRGVTPRDALIGAALMLGISALCSWLLISAKRAGMPVAVAMLQTLSFPGSFVLTMPFWLMKGQPWRAQAAIITVTMTILLAIAYFAAVS
jgi:hypothetical protein